jgi:hypothetical protein
MPGVDRDARNPTRLAIGRQWSYLWRVGRKKASSRDLASRLGSGLAEASAAAAAFRSGWQRATGPSDPADRMALEHERQNRQYHRDVQRFRSRLARLRGRAQYLTLAAAGGAAVAVADVAVDGPEGLFFIGLPVAVFGALGARRARQQASSLVEPAPPVAPPPPPRPLPPGVPGAAESARLHRVRVQLASLMPTIADLHEDAALELRRADYEAAPALAALVDRLGVLHRVAVEMAGTSAEATARRSAEEVRSRLAQGVEMYDELLNATLQMVSAPDPRRAPSVALELSVRELTAYTEGLQVAAVDIGSDV